MKRPRLYKMIWLGVIFESIGIMLGILIGSFSDKDMYFGIQFLMYPSEILKELAPVVAFLIAIIFSLLSLIDVTKKSNYSEIELPTYRKLQVMIVSVTVGVTGVILSLILLSKLLSVS